MRLEPWTESMPATLSDSCAITTGGAGPTPEIIPRILASMDSEVRRH